VTDVTVEQYQDGAELSAADEQLLRELAERAPVGGLATPAARPPYSRRGLPTIAPGRGGVLPSGSCGTGRRYHGQLGLLDRDPGQQPHQRGNGAGCQGQTNSSAGPGRRSPTLRYGYPS